MILGVTLPTATPFCRLSGQMEALSCPQASLSSHTHPQVARTCGWAPGNSLGPFYGWPGRSDAETVMVVGYTRERIRVWVPLAIIGQPGIRVDAPHHPHSDRDDDGQECGDPNEMPEDDHGSTHRPERRRYTRSQLSHSTVRTAATVSKSSS